MFGLLLLFEKKWKVNYCNKNLNLFLSKFKLRVCVNKRCDSLFVSKWFWVYFMVWIIYECYVVFCRGNVVFMFVENWLYVWNNFF